MAGLSARTATAKTSPARAGARRGGARSRATVPRATTDAGAAGLPRYLQGAAGGGQALPGAVRTEMEGRFGAPLGGVRVHAGGAAADSAAAMGARAYAAGNDVVFGDGSGGSHYAPQSAEGRGLLAHELTHVVQQQRAGSSATQASVADGGARKDGAEREAETNAQRANSSAPLTAVQAPAAPVQREEGFIGSVGSALGNAAGAVGGAVGDVVDAGVEAVGSVAMSLVRNVAPQLVPIIERGPVAWLRDQVAEAFDGLAGVLNALDPSGTLTAMLAVFTGLVQRASDIATALVSGDCQPLLDAIDQMKTFVTEVAGEAWDRLTTFLQPVGDFFTDLWSGYGAPAVEWLQRKAGAVWARVEQFGADLWNWTAPVRSVVGGAWGWVREQLFGPADAAGADSSGGIVGWVTGKAGEAWGWVKEQTAPVWQPIAATAQRVTDMLPPPWLRNFGQQMQQMSTHLTASATAMEGGKGVAENRDTLASVLPSVTRVIATVRNVVVDAGSWVSTKVGAFGSAITSVMGQLRASSLLAVLASALGWLEDAALRLVAWAQEKVAGLFDWLLQGFDALSPFVERAAGVVRRLIGVVGDLMSLPQLILSSVWELIPCCIREPIKNFVFHQILARIPVFGQFFSDETLLPRVQATAMRILRQVFVDGDLAGAAWSFFQAALRVLGLPPELVVQVLAKAAAAIGDILTDPIGFLVNLLGAVKAGFGKFFDNIGTHLLNGVSGWLFGQAQSAGITPPTDYSIGSIFAFVLQVLGISVEHVFERLARKLDPTTVARMRQILSVATGVWHFISVLVNDGPAALWVEIQSQLSNLWDRVLDGVIGWVTEAIIGRATRWLLGLLDVTGIMPVINTLVAVYNAIESFVQYLRQMLEIVSRVLDGVLEIAHGQIEGAATFLENALDAAMPVAIGFLANQFGLGNVGERMHELLESVRAMVDTAIDWLIDQGIALGQAFIQLARSGAAAVRGAVESVLRWWVANVAFTAADGIEHHLRFEGEGASAQLIVESTPKRFQVFLDGISDRSKATDKALAQRLFDELKALQAQAASATPDSDFGTRIGNKTNELSVVAARLMPATDRAGIDRASPPQFGDLTDGFGTSVVVPTLTSNMPPGDSPRVDGGAWEHLRRRLTREGGRSVYVRGHLLNHHIGGPGHTWANLTPLTQEANNGPEDSMLNSFEAPIKRAVDAGQTVSNFRVTVGRGRLPSATPLREIDAEIAATRNARELTRLRAVRQVVDAEQTVPRSVTMRAQILSAGRADVEPPGPVAHDINNKPSREWRNYTVRSA